MREGMKIMKKDYMIEARNIVLPKPNNTI